MLPHREDGVDEGVRHDVARGGVESGLRLLVEHSSLLEGGGDLKNKSTRHTPGCQQ